MLIFQQKKAVTVVAAFFAFPAMRRCRLLGVRLVPYRFYFFDDFGIGRAGCDDVCKFFGFDPKFLQELSVSGSRIDVVTDAASQFCAGFICYAREPGHVAHVKLTAARSKVNSGTEFVHCISLLLL